MNSYDMQVELGINNSRFEYVYDENEGRRVITQMENKTMEDYGQGKDSYLVEILYTNGEICRKIFNNDNSKQEAMEFLNNTQRDAKPLSIVKTKIRQVYSSDS